MVAAERVARSAKKSLRSTWNREQYSEHEYYLHPFLVADKGDCHGSVVNDPDGATPVRRFARKRPFAEPRTRRLRMAAMAKGESVADHRSATDRSRSEPCWLSLSSSSIRFSLRQRIRQEIRHKAAIYLYCIDFSSVFSAERFAKIAAMTTAKSKYPYSAVHQISAH